MGTTAGAQLASTLNAQLATATPTGGWCTFLGRAPGSPLIAGDAEKIAGYISDELTRRLWPQLLNPLLSGLTFTKINETARATYNVVAALIAAGAPCDQLPNDLSQHPQIRQPDNFGEVLGGIVQVALDWTGLGDLVIKAAILIGIVVLLLMAIRRVIR